MIKKITQKEVRKIIKAIKEVEAANKKAYFNKVIFFISNDTLYKEIHFIGCKLSETFENRDYVSCVELDENFIFSSEHTMLDNIRDIQLNVNELVEKYNNK